MNRVFNLSNDTIVNYNYYEIVFQCYQKRNVLCDLLGRKMFIIFDRFSRLNFREDAYQKEDNSYNDIRFEEACILYNLGAMYSRLGANESRRSNDVRRTRHHSLYATETRFILEH